MFGKVRSFQRSLVSNLSVLVALIAVAMLVVSFFALRSTVRQTSSVMMEQVVDTAIERNNEFFDGIEKMFIMVDFWAANRWSGAWDTYEFDQTFPPLLLALYEASAIYVAQRSGDFYLLSRENEQWVSWTVRPVAWGNRALVRHWTDANPLPSERWEDIDFDVREQSWFSGALRLIEDTSGDQPLAERMFMGSPSPGLFIAEPGWPAAMARRNSLGEPFVFAFERSLAGITRGTFEERILDNGLLLSLYGDPSDRSNFVLTGVPGDPRITDIDEALGYVLESPDKLGGPVTALLDRIYAGRTTRLNEALRFKVAGQSWLGVARQVTGNVFDDHQNEPTWLVAMVPEADIRARLPDFTIAVLVLAGLALIAAILRALSLSGSYSRPIEALVEQSRRMQRLDFEHESGARSKILEIDILAGTLESMRNALRAYVSVSEEVRIADAIVRASVPASLPRPEGYEIEASWQPADESGGDMFDVVVDKEPADPPRPVGLLILEPEGYGIEAAVLSAQLRAIFRNRWRDRQPIETIAERMSDCLRSDLLDAGSVGVWIGLLEPESGRLDSVLAGFSGNLVYHAAAESRTRIIEGRTLPLSATETTAPPARQTITLGAGDTVVMVSNGVIDALDSNRHRFGIRKVETTLVQDGRERSASQVIEALEEAFLAHVDTAKQRTDRTILAVRRAL